MPFIDSVMVEEFGCAGGLDYRGFLVVSIYKHRHDIVLEGYISERGVMGIHCFECSFRITHNLPRSTPAVIIIENQNTLISSQNLMS